jgi:hypothetical protein
MDDRIDQATLEAAMAKLRLGRVPRDVARLNDHIVGAMEAVGEFCTDRRAREMLGAARVVQRAYEQGWAGHKSSREAEG